MDIHSHFSVADPTDHIVSGMGQIKFFREIYDLRFSMFSIFIGKREGERLLSSHPCLQHCKQFILFQKQDIGILNAFCQIHCHLLQQHSGAETGGFRSGTL